jgi:hypothetical protein
MPQVLFQMRAVLPSAPSPAQRNPTRDVDSVMRRLRTHRRLLGLIRVARRPFLARAADREGIRRFCPRGAAVPFGALARGDGPGGVATALRRGRFGELALGADGWACAAFAVRSRRCVSVASSSATRCRMLPSSRRCFRARASDSSRRARASRAIASWRAACARNSPYIIDSRSN